MNCPWDPLGPLAEDVETKGLRTFEAQRTGAAPWITTGAKLSCIISLRSEGCHEFLSLWLLLLYIYICNIYIYTRIYDIYVYIHICIIIYTYIHYIDVGLTKHGRFTSDFRLFFGQDDWDAHGCRFGVRSINSDHFSEKVGNTINGPLKEVFPTWVYIKYIFRPIKPIWSK